MTTITTKLIDRTQLGEAWGPGHYGPSTTITLDDATYAIGAGTSDSWLAWDTPWGVAIVTRNSRMRYVGVELLDPDWQAPFDATQGINHTRSVAFFQDTREGQIGPRDTYDYTDRTILRRTLEGIE